MSRKSIALAVACLATLYAASPAHGWTVTTTTRTTYGSAPMSRSGPSLDAHGNVVDTGQTRSQGLAPETRDALAAPEGSDAHYRGELCSGLGTFAEQRACLARR